MSFTQCSSVLEPHRAAVLAGVGAARKDAGLRIDRHCLATAERRAGFDDSVAELCQTVRGRSRHAALELELALVGEAARAIERLCTDMPKSNTLVRKWVWPTGWKCPPMTPNGIAARPPSITMPGMIVCSGRLPGAMRLGCAGSITKPDPRLWNITPLSLLISAVPNDWNSELMNETALPSLSTIEI